MRSTPASPLQVAECARERREREFEHDNVLENRTEKYHCNVIDSVPTGARRTIAAVEGTVAAVLARLPSGPHRRLLVAVSGGPDSVTAVHALWRIHCRAGFQFAAAHLNHNIRGLESERDERFVRELCGRLGIELVVERVYGLRRPNLEERARQLRYAFLNRAADALKADFIVLGHHQDDQAETLLLRLIRGTGMTGLTAMAELGPGRLVRPLLGLNRATLLAYLTAIGADYVVDSSNLEMSTLRNRVRHRLLPALEREYVPGITRRLAELASEMRDVNSFIQGEASRLLQTRLMPPGHASAAARSRRIDLRNFGSVGCALARAMMHSRDYRRPSQD
jgi:tRNA(Ile)-lysidine synthetase-like protein